MDTQSQKKNILNILVAGVLEALGVLVCALSLFLIGKVYPQVEAQVSSFWLAVLLVCIGRIWFVLLLTLTLAGAKERFRNIVYLCCFMVLLAYLAHYLSMVAIHV